VYEEAENKEVIFGSKTIGPVMKEILQSMKKGEVTISSISAEYVS
jgi:hypothetical protein